MADTSSESDLQVPDFLGILPLRGTVIFPSAVVPLGAGRAASVRLVEEALRGSRLIGAVMQRDPSEESPDAAGLHPVGTVVVIHKAVKQADGTLRLVVQGLWRFRLLELIETTPSLRARIERLQDEGPAPPPGAGEAAARGGAAGGAAAPRRAAGRGRGARAERDVALPEGRRALAHAPRRARRRRDGRRGAGRGRRPDRGPPAPPAAAPPPGAGR